MRRSGFALLMLSCLLLLVGCQSAASAATPSITRATPTSAPTPTALPITPTPAQQAICPQLPAAAPGPATSAPLSLYVETSDGAFIALNASDGSVRWKEDSAALGSPAGSVTVAQNVVYAAAEDGEIFALNASNGGLRWCSQAGTGLLSPTFHGALPLAVSPGTVYLGGPSGMLLALSASDGKQQWQAQAEGGILALAVAAGQVYVSSEGMTDDTLSAFDASTGKEVWHVQTGNGMFSQPAVANGVVYVKEGNPNFPSFLYALRASDGKQQWQMQFQDGGALSAPVVVNGVIYAVDTQGAYAFDASTGAQRWSAQHQGIANMGPVADTSGLYFASANGNTGQITIVALNLSDGSPRWQEQPTIAALAPGGTLVHASSGTGLTVFAAANGMVYVTSLTASGALNASNGKELWSAAGTALALG